MKIGLVLPTRDEVGGQTPRYTEIRDLALQAEVYGLDSLWVYDHLLYREPQRAPIGIWEGWTILTAIAEVTKQVQLGTLVACTAFRNPAILAKMAATLDEVSAGRLVLGLGAGWNEAEFAAFNLPFDHRVARFEEALFIIRTLLTRGAVDFEGVYYSARNCELRPRGPRLNGPPVLIGGIGPRLLRLTARWADAWNVAYIGAAESLIAIREQLTAACAEVGRDPSTLEITVTLTLSYPDLGPPEQWMRQPLTGSEEDLASSLHAFERAGANHIMFHCAPANRATLQRLGRAVSIYRSAGGSSSAHLAAHQNWPG